MVNTLQKSSSPEQADRFPRNLVCSIGDSSPSQLGLTLTYFTARSNVVTWAFPLEKVKIVDFSETIAASDLKVGRSRHLIEYMKVSEY